MSITRPIYGGSRGGPADERFDSSPNAGGTSDFDTITHPGATRRGCLEIRLNGGPPERHVLTETHVVIGRIPGVSVFLDHHTVSRRHAEMFCDPFGRVWIRDTGSTNGTLVNDEPVHERLLSPGDRIGIGDYTITFTFDTRDARRWLGRSPPVEYEKPAAIRTLLDFEPPRIAAEHLRTLLELSRRLIAVESPDDRMGELCQLAVRGDFHALSAVVLRLDETTATRISRTYHPGGLIGEDAPYVSRSVLSAVRDTREPVIASNLQSQPTDTRSIELTIAREVMEMWVIACPLRVTATEVDVLYVTLPPSFGGAEWLSLFALAAEVFQQSEAAWAARKHEKDHAAIERELQTARQIQRALLPQRLDFLGLDVAVGFEPCKWVGGDHVDVVQLPDGRVLCTVADVCGKGLQAALVTSSLHTMVRASIESATSLSALMERVNRHLCDWLPSHSFVTMVAAAIDPGTGEIECVNAGHPPVLIVDRDGDLRFLQSAENPALGVAPFRVEAQRALLEFGDVLLMYTDGLTELRDVNKEMLGQDRLAERFARISAANPGERSSFMGDKLRAILDEFCGDQLPEDDRAFVLAQRSA
jgi:phosphoserine phosphatase RsbU/P